MASRTRIVSLKHHESPAHNTCPSCRTPTRASSSCDRMCAVRSSQGSTATTRRRLDSGTWNWLMCGAGRHLRVVRPPPPRAAAALQLRIEGRRCYSSHQSSAKDRRPRARTPPHLQWGSRRRHSSRCCLLPCTPSRLDARDRRGDDGGDSATPAPPSPATSAVRATQRTNALRAAGG